jgi:RNA polymerase sigma factor (sigma-70 family)
MADEAKRFLVRLPPVLHARIVDEASRDLRSLNAEVIVLLQEALEVRNARPRSVLSGLIPVPISSGELTFLPPTLDMALSQLTDKEREVLEMVGQGWSYRKIAERLGLSSTTVRDRMARVFRKLGVGSREELKYKMLSTLGERVPG